MDRRDGLNANRSNAPTRLSSDVSLPVQSTSQAAEATGSDCGCGPSGCDPSGCGPSGRGPSGRGLSDCDPSGGGPSGCGAPLPRREFLKVAGVGLMGTAVGSQRKVMAGGFTPADLKANHLVPIDKKLDPEWVKGLFARGTKEVYSGKGLANVAMPCGGIGSGQLYLCGDGTLGCWQIFNNAISNWVGNTHSTYLHRGVDRPVDQGFAVAIGDGETFELRPLCDGGFKRITFNGTYPIATIRYEDDNAPVAVEMEAFSPFIPLNMKDSGLPATVFNVTVHNTSSKPLPASVVGWLQNPVCTLTGQYVADERVTTISDVKGRRNMHHSAREAKQKPPAPERPPIVFEDFEKGSYEGWQVEGDAFGPAPATGTFTEDKQNEVTGFEGKGLVNTYRGGDGPMGKIVSRSFKIERPYINLKVGGGPHINQTCVALMVDGKAVRSVAGMATESLHWASWYVGDLRGREANFEIIDQAGSGWGHILVDQIEFSDAPRFEQSGTMHGMKDFGTMSLACAEPGQPGSLAKKLPDTLGKVVTDPGTHASPIGGKITGALRSAPVELRPGEKRTFTFVLGWHFPNAEHGHYYATRFADAGAVTDYVLDNYERLSSQTRLWRDTYYDSTLPYWLLDRLLSTVSTLATGTCEWWANGRFYAFEGVTCCGGTCTHVWNYAHTHARLFPEMGRNIREMQDFNPREHGGGFHPDTGLVGFRSDDNYAADGQCGTILKACREHLTSPDNSFLQRFWPRIKKALEYSIQQDVNNDGLIENTQHNTYDINYHGANTFVGSLYLAALRAGELMAREMGDDVFARHVRAIYERGRDLTLERLWDGEYFFQDVDLSKHPDHQYAHGCLSDQLFGQGWAHQLGLGYLYPPEKVRSALQAVWKYNWAPDIQPYNAKHPPFRWFISAGQAGLFTCTWPKSEYMPTGTSYKNEVWTGIEYQVAGHMIAEGLVKEGLAICRAVHDRYQPELYNPYNEIECGDHYARAMASWGVLLTLCGFNYHGPAGAIGFNPRITPNDFKAAFTAAEGWGTFTQKRGGDIAQRNELALHWGELRVRTIALMVPDGFKPASVRVELAGTPIQATLRQTDDRVDVQLGEKVTVGTGQTLSIVFEA